ncbi:MAG: hypothetical protein GU343_02215 [Nanoarchaeota archaeon]|jgi:hypothetical protein|nr:hypothetical protein [Nanoarchaeota archaeon]
MRLTRRDFIMLLIGASIGALVDSGLSYYLSKLEKLSAVTKKIYGGNESAATERVTITVTKTAINPQASQTYTTTTTVTETSTIPSPTTTTTTTAQPPRTLEEILFGNSDIQFIPLEVTNVNIDNNTAYLTVEDPLTKTELQIGLPIQYVSNGNINIGSLLSAVKGTNYKVYFVLGKAGLNQAIQQNGIWYLPPSIYYNIIISDRGWEDVNNALQNLWNGNATVVMPTLEQGPYANGGYDVWGWKNGSIIISYQNGQQVNSVEDSINLANSILGTPNNPNPTSKGIVHVDSIVSIKESGVYENKYPVYQVNNYFDTLIVFIPEQGYELFSNL